jgi:hypothetical protein
MQAQMAQMQEQLQKAQQATQENQALKIENQAIKADKAIDQERVQIEWFKAKADAQAKGATTELKTVDLSLKKDDQDHAHAIESAKLVQDAHAQTHQQQTDKARFAMDADGHEHSKAHDAEKLGQAERLANLKVSQQGKPTGATGNDADTGRKAVNS